MACMRLYAMVPQTTNTSRGCAALLASKGHRAETQMFSPLFVGETVVCSLHADN